jgi:AraC-like DNA-binding protein
MLPGLALTQPFDEVFQALGLQGVACHTHEFTPPWAVEFVECVPARFHLVLSGSCYVSVGRERLELAEHDFLLLPGGASHVLHDGLVVHGGKARVTRDARGVGAEIRESTPGVQAEVAVRLLSGQFAFDREARALLIQVLPVMLRGSLTQPADRGRLAALPLLLAHELQQARPGAATIVTRLVEILLVQVLRAHFEQACGGHGLLTAMFEPRLNAGLALMHARWNEPLALARVAAAAGMSRSSFAERFKTLTGTSPMSYLAHWRLLKSRRLLADRELSIARIARLCGHRSTEGYSRAFKRAFGLSPARWRTTNEG